jgi:hypothetical protein
MGRHRIVGRMHLILEVRVRRGNLCELARARARARVSGDGGRRC